MRTRWRCISCITILYASIRRSKVTPAMAAGATDKLWEIGDIVEVLERWEFDHSSISSEYNMSWINNLRNG